MRTLRLTAADIDALARIIDAEAGNQPPQGKIGVLFTVLNRASSPSFPDGVRNVIEQRNQFEPMIGRKSVFDLPDAKPDTVSLVSTALAGISSGQLQDPTNGATFFQNVAITNARGTNFAASPPVAQIGDHSFYNRYKLNPPAEVEPYTVALGAAPDAPASPSSPSSFSLISGTLPNYDSDSPTQPEAPRRIARRSPFTSGYAAAILQNQAEAIQATVPSTQGHPTPSATEPPSSPFARAFSSAPPSQGQYGLRPARDDVNLDSIAPEVLSAARAAASAFGSDLVVNSGFRTQAHQDRIRAAGDPNRPSVAKNSHHTSGTGLDISIKGMSREDQARLLDALAAAGFTGFGHYNSHIHADFRSAVPSSFGTRSNWAGWTNMPEELMNVLKARGFAPGLSSDRIRRGFA